MDREAWRAMVHGVTKSRTRLSEHARVHMWRPRVVPEASCQALPCPLPQATGTSPTSAAT